MSDKKYLESFIHLEDDATASNSEFFQVVPDCLQENCSCVLNAEVSIVYSVTEIMLRCVLQISHPIVLVLC